MAFRVLIIGGTGQVGAAVVRALVAEASCAEVVMVNRKAIPLTANHRLRQVILFWFEKSLPVLRGDSVTVLGRGHLPVPLDVTFRRFTAC
jgi:nucleoside-diphosphate-sugar epimerase